MGIPAPAGVAASGLPPAGDQANAVLTGTFGAIGVSQPFAFRGPMNLAIWASVVTALTVTAGSLSASVASGTGLAAGVAVKSTLVPPGTIWGAFSGTSGTLALPPMTYPGSVSVSAARIADLPVTAGLVGSTVSSPRFAAGTTVTAVLVPAVPPTGATPGGGAGSPGSLGIVEVSTLPLSAPAVTSPKDFFTFSGVSGEILASGVDAAASFSGAALLYVGSVQIERSFDGGYTFIPCNIGNAGALAQYSAGSPVSITFGEPEKNVLYRLNCTAWTSGTINYRISQTGGAAESLAIGPLSNG